MSQGRKGRTCLFSILALLLPRRLSLWGEIELFFFFFSEYKFQTKQEKTVPFKTLGTCVRHAMQS